MKKRGFGIGRWNGFGGKIEGVETPEENLKREFVEEVGLTLQKVTPRGQIYFHYNHIGDVYVVHIFEINEYSGEIIESEEMKPQWHSLNEIPYDQMWLDDKYWLPEFIAGQEINKNFNFFSFEKLVI